MLLTRLLANYNPGYMPPSPRGSCSAYAPVASVHFTHAPPLPLQPGPPEADLDAAVDYHALARQHVITSSADLEGAALVQTKHKPLVIRAVASIFQVGGHY